MWQIFKVSAILCFGNYFLELKTYGEASKYHLWLGLVLILLILVTGMFSYYQDSKSSRIMDSFLQMVPQWAKVLRDGERKELPVIELVVGDIVLLETGCPLILESWNVKVKWDAFYHRTAHETFLFSYGTKQEPFSSLASISRFVQSFIIWR